MGRLRTVFCRSGREAPELRADKASEMVGIQLSFLARVTQLRRHQNRPVAGCCCQCKRQGFAEHLMNVKKMASDVCNHFIRSMSGLTALFQVCMHVDEDTKDFMSHAFGFRGLARARASVSSSRGNESGGSQRLRSCLRKSEHQENTTVQELRSQVLSTLGRVEAEASDSPFYTSARHSSHRVRPTQSKPFQDRGGQRLLGKNA